MHAAINTASKGDGRVVPWNKGKLIGQKPPLKLKEIWAIRIRLQLDHRAREIRCRALANQQAERADPARTENMRRRTVPGDHTSSGAKGTAPL